MTGLARVRKPGGSPPTVRVVEEVAAAHQGARVRQFLTEHLGCGSIDLERPAFIDTRNGDGRRTSRTPRRHREASAMNPSNDIVMRETTLLIDVRRWSMRVAYRPPEAAGFICNRAALAG